jgi:uncharacterized membrane protein
MAAETRSMGESLEASRLVGFSDGVFAVVITLLVLNIQVPSEPISLHALMAQQCPSYLIFIVTFAMVGIKWLNHHRLFALIRRVDTLLSVLNLVLLLGICLVPFTAAMIAKYMTTPDAAFASVIYGIVWTINGFLYTAILAYARKKGFVESSPGTRRLVSLYVFGPLGYLVAIGLSFLNIYAGISLYLAIVLLYIPPQRLQRP